MSATDMIDELWKALVNNNNLSEVMQFLKLLINKCEIEGPIMQHTDVQNSKII